MENHIKIGDFVKLTGCTLKAINYYHKIGLLPEPQRSTGGYRLYGPADLNRMRLIKRLKSMGLDLKQIKEIAGNLPNPKTSREVLQSLRREMLNEKKTLEERLAKIDTLLSEDAPMLDEDSFNSPSFQMMTEALGEDQIEKYARTCPEIYDQHRKLYGILDDFQWGEDFRENFGILAEYFKTHPEQYQLALESGARWAEISHLSEDDPQIEAFAREAAALVKSMPPVKEIICTHTGMKMPFESLYQEMVAGVLSPAQLKYQQLFENLLQSED
ncbi:MAG TPA: MerR family transcriptional regulator [Syntrophomonadaceae bacterium]|nr:MerR family transcriptional regulator [Syntrophomonadaceae bacterium]